MKTLLWIVVLLLGGLTMSEARTANYRAALLAIAGDVDSLKAEFPQMHDFDVARNVRPVELEISYSYHTHRSTERGGWTSGVPNPDDDGIWLYIDFHDPATMAQIDTQPVYPPLAIGEKRVAVLMLEGAKTRSVAARIHQILLKHGVHPPVR